MKIRNKRNKLYALLLISVGVGILITFKDATCLLLTGLAGGSLFFSKENWID